MMMSAMPLRKDNKPTRLPRMGGRADFRMTALWVLFAANTLILGAFYHAEIRDTVHPVRVMERVGLIEAQTPVVAEAASPTALSAVATLRFAVELPRLSAVEKPSADAHVLAYEFALAPVFEAAMAPTPELVTEVQSRLARMGYFTGTLDGVLGGDTRAALAAWQRAYGFLPTGHLEERVIVSLRERTQAAGAMPLLSATEGAALPVGAGATPAVDREGFGTITEQTSSRP